MQTLNATTPQLTAEATAPSESTTAARGSPANGARLFYFNVSDRKWWLWTVTTALLFAGLAGYAEAYAAAIALTVAQTVYTIGRARSLSAFPVQLRVAYLGLLFVCSIPAMRWLFWWPALGTLALIVFGYCLLARVLSLLPWNSTESYSLSRIGRTFFSKPDPSRVSASCVSGGTGSLCTIEAQVCPPATASS